MCLTFFNHLYITECTSSSAAVFILFAFWKDCFPRLPQIFCFYFSTNVKLCLWWHHIFFDVAFDVTFLQILIFVRKTRCRKLSFLLDVCTTAILKQTKVIFDCKRFSRNYKIECFDDTLTNSRETFKNWSSVGLKNCEN